MLAALGVVVPGEQATVGWILGGSLPALERYGLAAVLMAYPGRLVVRPDPQRVRAACAAAAVAVAVVLGRGLWMATRHGEPVRAAAHAALPVLPDAPDRSTQVFVLTVLAGVLIALALAMAAAPAPPPSGAAERARVRALVQDPDSGSLAPFATRADKTYVFSPGGDAVIGYRVRFGVALAGGDPVGAAGAAAAAVGAFAELCAVRGWRPAVLGSASATAGIWRAAGVRRAVEIGDEAVLDPAGFSLATRPMRNLRQAVRRAGNAGVQVTVGGPDPRLLSRVSLNFAGMRRVYAGETRAARLALVPLRVLDRWIELRTLYRFTDKFHPVWRPRQLRMRSWLDIVAVGAAALTSEFGARPATRPSGNSPEPGVLAAALRAAAPRRR
jgi:lysylphosphatidylglycerol synthetase-like protein (DUF2156 family)